MTDKLFSRRQFLATGLLASMVASTPLLAATKSLAAIPVPMVKPRPPRLLMLDAGHGGRDPGAIGRSGTYEKHVTLDLARRMADILSGKPGVTVKLTRDDDVFLPLEERVRISRDAHADLFMSVHADSAPNESAHGLSVYTLSPKASDNFAQHLADSENSADMAGGLDLPPADKDVTAILTDLTARHTRNTALHARASFVDMVGKNWHLLDNPMRAANFVVLRAPDVPSMLVETGFLSNPHDEAILRQPEERARIARIMAHDLATILDSPLFA
ncbi:MAG: N-acetylmuramoyl-L-alanine amidase [Alphaproteobacteria bacterium]|nr:N-acetylmuramoyl-L-alanine amidase [Alphaproteobacteria bacterium]